MAIAKLQNNITAATSGTLTGVSAGSLLVACSAVLVSTSVTFSDNNGGTWATAGTFFDASVGATIAIGYSMNHNAGSTTVSFSASAGPFPSLALVEFSGAATTSALDNTPAGNHVTASTTHTATSVTPSQAGCVVVCCDTVDAAAPTVGVGSGFTLIGYDSTAPFFAEFQIQTTATPVAATVTVSPSAAGGLMSAVFRAGGAAATLLPPQLFVRQAVNRASTY
jgi:hypothetical protein